MKLSDSEKLIRKFMGTSMTYYRTWNTIIPLAKILHDRSKYESVSFPDKTGYDIDILYNECVDYIIWLNKQK